MKKFALIGSFGAILLAFAAIMTIALPLHSTAIKALTTVAWLGGLVILTLAVLHPIRDVRRRVRNLNREVRSLKSGKGTPKQVGAITAPQHKSQAKAYKDSLTELRNSLPSSTGSHHYKGSGATMSIIAPEPERFRSLFASIFHGDLLAEEIHQSDGLIVTLESSIPSANVTRAVYSAFEADIPIIMQVVGNLNCISNLGLVGYASVLFHADEEVVEELVDLVGHSRVFVSSFGVDVMSANPVGSYRYNLPQALYSGSGATGNKEVIRDQKVIFDELAKNDYLAIADESWDEGSGITSAYAPLAFPCDESESLAFHKIFSYAVHIAENKGSSTDTGSRLSALQAIGVPVLSNYSVAIFNQMPWLRIIAERMDLSGIFSSEARRDAEAAAQIGASSIITTENSFLKTSEMLERVGLEPILSRRDTILVVGRGDLNRVRMMVERQSFNKVKLVSEEDLNSVELASFGYATIMSDRHDYGRDYLRDRFAAFIYTDSLIVTQEGGYIGGEFSEGRRHEFAMLNIDPEISLISTEHSQSREILMNKVSNLTFDCYLVDHYGVDYSLYLSHSYQRIEDHDTELTVIIPIYNNGSYLQHKALPSLKLNDSFQDMEILLIDDGSDDETTLAICEELSSVYSNVHFYSFRDGGSGSASRPRNYGIGIAQSELITFLDPDNEISIGGYDRLLSHYRTEKAKNPNIDFVSGFQAKIAVKRAYTGKHTRVSAEVVEDFNDKFFDKGIFPVISTQAAVISREFFERSGLRFVERAVGQDTLFGWELILNAKAGVFVKDAFLLYYAERGDSVTNVVGAKYFARVLINEKAKYEVLVNHGLLENYSSSHLPQFVVSWYLPRLQRVPKDQYFDARADLEEIVALYGRELSDFEG